MIKKKKEKQNSIINKHNNNDIDDWIPFFYIFIYLFLLILKSIYIKMTTKPEEQFKHTCY